MSESYYCKTRPANLVTEFYNASTRQENGVSKYPYICQVMSSWEIFMNHTTSVGKSVDWKSYNRTY